MGEMSMNHSEILNAVAPCSLLCHTCFGYKNGAVSYHASQLFELYKGWYEGHKLGYGDTPTAEQIDKLNKIQNFNETLKNLMKADCLGCRESCGKAGGCIKNCIVPECTKQHNVEFCGFCNEFPCNKNDAVFSPNVLKKWFEGNTYIRENGAEAYFEKSKFIAHYIEFYTE